METKVAGRVVELRVAEGDYVEKGQVIARIDTDTQKTQQQQAQAAVASQYAQLQQVVIASQSASGTLDAKLRAAEARNSAGVLTRLCFCSILRKEYEWTPVATG